MHLPCRFIRFDPEEPNSFIAGVGNILEIRGEESTIVVRAILRNGSSINGGGSCGNHWIFFGEKCLSVLSKKALHIERTLNFREWICDAIFLENYVAILFAHSRVVLYRHENDDLVQESSFQCSEKCTLFSGKLFGGNLNSLTAILGTAFGEILIWKPTESPEPIKCLQGHSGVVFDANLNEKLNILASVSDDRTIRVWEFRDASRVELLNEPLIGYGHEARPWKVSVEDNGLIISSGEDSLICLWRYAKARLDLWKIIDTNSGSIRSFHFSNGVLVFGSDGGGIGKICVPVPFSSIQYDLISEQKTSLVFHGKTIDQICSIANDGVFETQTDGIISSRFKSGVDLSHASISKTKKDFLIGSFHGSVLHGKLGDNALFKFVHEFSQPLHNVSILRKDGNSLLFLVCFGDGELEIRDVKEPNSVIAKAKLPPGRQRWTTASLLCCSESLFVVGDRNGSIFIFQFDKTDPIQSIWKIHGRHGVTDLVQEQHRIYSIGRDGFLRIWSFKKAKLSLVEARRLKIEWPAKFVRRNGQLLIAGFCANRFTIIELESERNLCEIECGGGRRQWDLAISDNTCSLAFIKEGVAYVAKSHLWEIKFYKEPISKQKINCMTKVEVGKREFVALAGEDTKITVMECGNGDETRVMQRLSGHISSVQCICSVPSSSTSSIISGGGRNQLLKWDYDKDTKTWVPAGILSDSEEADARFTSVHCSSSGKQIYVAAARTDGVVIFFDINTLDEVKVVRDLFLSAVRILEVDHGGFIMTGSDTSGKIRLLRLGKELETVNEISARVDNAGLSCNSSAWTHSGYLLSLVGSESGQLHLTLLDCVDDNFLVLQMETVEPQCHASTVTDVQISTENKWLIGVSTDQRASVWSFELSEKKVTTTLKSIVILSVGDPLASVMIRNLYLFAGGGLEAIDIQ